MKKSSAANQIEHAGGDTKISKLNGTIEHGVCSSEKHDIAQLVWKYFKSDIGEALRQISEELDEQRQAEAK